MRETRPCLLTALCCLALGGCVAGGAGGGSAGANFEQRLQQQDVALKQLQTANAESWNQVQAMRQEMDVLKGMVDDINNAGGARALADRVARHDAALRQVESNMALSLNLGTPPSGARMPAAPATPAASPSAPAVPAASPGSPAIPAAFPGAAAGGAAGAAAGAAAVPQPGEDTWGQESPRPQPAQAAPQKDLPNALYDAGIQSFQARRYEEARRSFSDFVGAYGSHELAPDAHFHLAESLFQGNQFGDAALSYETVISKYPKSPRVPAAYLKQGICFSKLGQKTAANARLTDLIRKYPRSPEAARARQFLKTNK